MPKYIKADHSFLSSWCLQAVAVFQNFVDGKFGKHVDQVSEDAEIS